MSYSGHKRYKSRREKSKLIKRRTKAVVIAAIVIGLVLIINNWRYLYDYWRTSMY